MNTLEMLFIAIPVSVILTLIILIFFGKSTIEITINDEEVDEPAPAPVVEEVVKPKRRYKKRKKKVVAPVAPAVVETPKKSVGRPRKQQ